MTEAVVGQLLEVGGGETRIWREKRQRDKFLELGRTRERGRSEKVLPFTKGYSYSTCSQGVAGADYNLNPNKHRHTSRALSDCS